MYVILESKIINLKENVYISEQNFLSHNLKIFHYRINFTGYNSFSLEFHSELEKLIIFNHFVEAVKNCNKEYVDLRETEKRLKNILSEINEIKKDDEQEKQKLKLKAKHGLSIPKYKKLEGALST